MSVCPQNHATGVPGPAPLSDRPRTRVLRARRRGGRFRSFAAAFTAGVVAVALVPAAHAFLTSPGGGSGARGPRLDGTVTPRLPRRPAPPPNILFVIMDDVGIDQMEVFGYGGGTAPTTPNIGDIAGAGVRFHNAWSMPACSTSRAVFFTGRFPFRTDVLGALGPDDLANSMVSPYETTAPKLLAQRGYESALFGKFHVALQGHDPAGIAAPANLGWNFFAGWLDETGDPSSIDLTAGGVAPEGTSYGCGFVPSERLGGADTGACYMADGSCRELASVGLVPPGRICRDRGGILDPGVTCQSPPPDLDFETLSGHYVSPLVYNYPDGSAEEVPPTDPRARTFRAEFAVDAAIEWINDRPADRPWMATVSFASDHTPLMQPPVDEPLPGNAASSELDCTNSVAQRAISNLMIESLDYQVGRLLVETGLAERGADGRLIYRPRASDTMIVLLGDNGSLGATVKLPFDPSRAKGTAYQTGVWVPLVVAGPLVKSPDRSVGHMVNIADVFGLFGEVAGIDVEAAVPRPIDAFPLLPYLVNPQQSAIRKWNFTQVGPNLQANGAINGPCIISTTCTQIPVTKSVCEDNNGVWYGEGSTVAGVPAEGFQYCCEALDFLVEQGCTAPDCVLPGIAPLDAVGVRNDRYKLVENSWKAYVSPDQPCVDTTTTEFFEIDQAVPLPKIDKAGTELPLDSLTPLQQRNFDALSARLEAILASEPACPGDGNIDLVVDALDLDDWRFYEQSTGLSSVYDLNIDGLTNGDDEAIIQENLGLDCRTDLPLAAAVAAHQGSRR
jgi:hypothetical protein